MRMNSLPGKKPPELLAPAGNYECFRAALAMGADAVYLAGKNFGARSYADNFERAEIESCVQFAHLRGAKVYAAVNTLVGDREIPELVDFLKFLQSARVDGVIVQDTAIPELARRHNIALGLHASTQMTVHNLNGAKAAAELGFSRVVLARELSFDEIKYISENCGIETEIFVHGAMCMSYSGQCLMSSALGGRSGNRGRCAQPCRQPYRTDRGEKFVLSLKDMALINEIDKLTDCGAASLKIEGRMKGAAYTASVVEIYRRCLDERRKPTKDELDRLNRVFYRGGLSSGYFDGKTGPRMFAFDKPDNPYAESVREAEKAVLARAAQNENNFKIPLKAEIRFNTGAPIRLKVKAQSGASTDVKSDYIVQAAKTKPTDADKIIGQLSKTGGSVFEFDDISVKHGGGFAPLSEINALRRLALENVKADILRRYDGAGPAKPKLPPPPNDIPDGPERRGVTADVRDRGQFRALLEFERENEKELAYIGVPIDELCEDPAPYEPETERIIILPRNIMHKDEYENYEKQLKRLKGLGFTRLRIENISEILRRDEFELFGGRRLNITNGLSAELMRRSAGLRSIFLSPELNMAQIRETAACLPCEIVIYGYQPLMLTENCVARNLGRCPCGNEINYLTDRLGKKFPIIRDGGSCKTVLLNTCPTFMCDKMGEVKQSGAALLNLCFTIEGGDAVKKICAACFGGNYRPREFTRFHYYKGAITEKANRIKI